MNAVVSAALNNTPFADQLPCQACDGRGFVLGTDDEAKYCGTCHGNRVYALVEDNPLDREARKMRQSFEKVGQLPRLTGWNVYSEHSFLQ